MHEPLKTPEPSELLDSVVHLAPISIHGREKRGQILHGAREVFRASGFDGASMGQIARAAGVSKGTLYVYFSSKVDLFAALVTEECEQTAEHCFDLDVDADVAASLTALGHRYIRAMIEPSKISTVRMVVGVAEKFPEIGRIFLAASHERGVERLAAWLRAKIERGELEIDDIELAAWQFVIGCHARIVMPMFFGEEAASEAEIGRVVNHTVDTFLRAFARRRRSCDSAGR
nr:TetR/AcrR family transcriptional regulator [Ancylobacter radicis]